MTKITTVTPLRSGHLDILIKIVGEVKIGPYFIRMSKFSLLNGITVVISFTFGEMRLDFFDAIFQKKKTMQTSTFVTRVPP